MQIETQLPSFTEDSEGYTSPEREEDLLSDDDVDSIGVASTGDGATSGEESHVSETHSMLDYQIVCM